MLDRHHRRRRDRVLGHARCRARRALPARPPPAQRRPARLRPADRPRPSDRHGDRPLAAARPPASSTASPPRTSASPSRSAPARSAGPTSASRTGSPAGRRRGARRAEGASGRATSGASSARPPSPGRSASACCSRRSRSSATPTAPRRSTGWIARLTMILAIWSLWPITHTIWPNPAERTAEPDETPGRHERPHDLEHEEAPLLAVQRVVGQDRRADQVQREVAARVRVDAAGLGGGEGGEDEQRAGDLDEHEESPSVAARRLGRPGTARTPRPGTAA